ncbi:MAG: hypothetical protein JSU86_09000 [Phycisphaerales bacterium]|nr:MAG: hypothetical protein JSU86_09000 [Phycisphaerales bacterium]
MRRAFVGTVSGGDDIYGDFEIDGQTITELCSFELGLAKVDPWTTEGNADTSYYHTAFRTGL